MTATTHRIAEYAQLIDALAAADRMREREGRAVYVYRVTTYEATTYGSRLGTAFWVTTEQGDGAEAVAVREAA